MTYGKRGSTATLGASLALLAFATIIFAAWVTHIVVTIKTASWGLLIAGALVFPLGIIHGIGVWFGIF